MINWKVRIRYKQFWMSLIPAMALVVQAVAAGEYPELIPEPVEEKTEDGKTVMIGMTYSDVMIILIQYRCAEGEYFIKMMRG